jgi:hypothetical protein
MSIRITNFSPYKTYHFLFDPMKLELKLNVYVEEQNIIFCRLEQILFHDKYNKAN